jgi:hypothetical protein
LGFKSDGTIVAWGINGDVPSPNADFVTVAAGAAHSLGLKSDGTVVAWGQNNYGQCNVPSPNADFVAVVGGWSHSVGLRDDGTVVAWGWNDYGQCNVPSPNSNFILVAAGMFHSLGVQRDPTSALGDIIAPASGGALAVLGMRPNPGRGGVQRLLFELGRSGGARLDVYDVAGRRVRRVAEGIFASGVNTVEWDGRAEDGRRVAPGVYWVRLHSVGRVASSKIVLLR